MARPLRLEYEGALYHITSRGNALERIFLNDEDRGRFLKVLGDGVWGQVFIFDVLVLTRYR
jgi:putative transposase